MENQTNYPPVQPVASSTSGANTVLLVVIILILAGFGYWWYTHRQQKAPAPEGNSIQVDVNLPAGSSGDTEPSSPTQ